MSDPVCIKLVTGTPSTLGRYKQWTQGPGGQVTYEDPALLEFYTLRNTL